MRKKKNALGLYLSGTGTDLDSVGDMSANYLYGDFIFYQLQHVSSDMITRYVGSGKLSDRIFRKY